MKKQNTTRRDFLKTGCVAAAGVALPYAITSAALGNKEKLPASDRIVLGHIGVGGRGGYLFGKCSTKDVQSVAFADCYEKNREGCAARTGGKAYTDFRDILARDDIDAVIIATPDHWHVPIAVMAARAGKDAYVEKPLGLTIEQDLICQKVFKEENRVFQYGTQQRESGHMKLARKMILAGKLGTLKTIEVHADDGAAGGSTVEVPVPAGFDYDMWLGPAPVTPYTVDRCKPKGTYWIYDQSIGYLAGWGAHPLDILVWCYDGDQKGPYTVEGTGTVPTEGLYDTVYDWDAKVTMADGVQMRFTPGPNSTKFIGSESSMELTRGAFRTNPTSLRPKDCPKHTRVEGREDVINHISNFVDAVRSRGQASSHIDDAVRSDVISHLCDIAIRTGEKLTWDPRTQQMIGGSEKAKSMIRRPMRAPWTLS